VVESDQLQEYAEYYVNGSVIALKHHRRLLNDRKAPERLLQESKRMKTKLQQEVVI
jgi:hypothetical protein